MSERNFIATGEYLEEVKKMKERLVSYGSLYLEVENELAIVNGFARTFSSLLTDTTKMVERLRDEHQNIIEMINWLEVKAEPHLIDRNLPMSTVKPVVLKIPMEEHAFEETKTISTTQTVGIEKVHIEPTEDPLESGTWNSADLLIVTQEKETKEQLILMKEQEKEHAIIEKKLAEKERWENSNWFGIICSLFEDETDHEPIPNFDEVAAKKFLADRIQYHQQMNDSDLAMCCETLSEHMCPAIVHEVFKFNTPSFSESLKIQKRFFGYIKTLGTKLKAVCLYKKGYEEGSQYCIKKFISKYISVQEEIRNNAAEIPKKLRSKKMQKLILSRIKSENLKEMDWKTSKTFFEQVSPEDCDSDSIEQEFDLLLLEEIEYTNHPVFVADGHILQKLASEGTPMKVLIHEYVDLVTLIVTV